MADDIEDQSRTRCETQATNVVQRRIEDLGTSSNPIILGASPVQPRFVNEPARSRPNLPSRTTRRKCPLGAYVEIIEGPRIARSSTNISHNMATPAIPVQTPAVDVGDEPMDQTSSTNSFNEGTPVLRVPANFEILMRCSICMEIFHNPATVSPCNHKFCYSCLLSWKRTNQTAVCPQCRGPIHSMQKDAQFNEVVESFLSTNPTKRRPANELEALDNMEAECTEWQNGTQRGRRRGSTGLPRTRARERSVRTPLLVRVSQIRAHRPTALLTRQRGGTMFLEDWFNI